MFKNWKYVEGSHHTAGREGVQQGDVLSPHINMYLQPGEISDMCSVRTYI